MTPRPATLAELHQRIVACELCPRLRAYARQVSATRRKAFATETYWGLPVPGFGDPRARLLLVGLAPAAHGALRTGRMFTGDRSGDFLFSALHRAGFANQALSRNREDGLRLRDAWLGASVRCAPPANKPTPQEFANCLPWLLDELRLLPRVRVLLTLGALGHRQLLRSLGLRPAAHPFAHGAEYEWNGRHLLACYHPSQQNTFTGLLTPAMMDGVLARARVLLDS
ncbi:MAG: uracil-DNA glycosylase [Terriglobales bacterium]